MEKVPAKVTLYFVVWLEFYCQFVLGSSVYYESEAGRHITELLTRTRRTSAGPRGWLGNISASFVSAA